MKTQIRRGIYWGKKHAFTKTMENLSELIVREFSKIQAKNFKNEKLSEYT